MQLGTPTALAIASIYPVWATLLGALHLHEAVGPLRMLGTVLCITGVVWLVRMQPGGKPAADAGSAPPRRWGGVVLALLASLLWAGNTYTIKRGATGLPLWSANALRYAMATLLLGAFFVMQRRRAPLPSPLVPKARLLGSWPWRSAARWPTTAAGRWRRA